MSRGNGRRMLAWPVLAILAVGVNARGQTGVRKTTTRTVSVAGDKQWVDTGIDVQAGDHVTLTATGMLQYLTGKPTGPEGQPRGWRDLITVYPLNSAGRGALTGRIAEGDAAEAFAVGVRREFDAQTTGRLFLGINQPSNEAGTGSFKVSVTIVPGVPTTSGAAAGVTVSTAPMTEISPDTLGKLPRRVSDPAGRPGDMVNFLLVGPKDVLEGAFHAAGWVSVDRSTKDAVLHGLLGSLSKEAYVQMPMSTLTLFGRPQDYGFAHAEPLSVVATRHHLRIWKTDFVVDGQAAWAGAGTHDMGFERDQRNGGITHHIDPAIDSERDFIGKSLGETGKIVRMGYVTPADKLTEAKTATGESFHSDGRILVMMLATSTQRDRSTAFADLFCAVLEQEHPDPGTWGSCSQYLETQSSGQTISLGAIPTTYRVLILPGIFNPCVSATPAFKQGQDDLRQKFGLTVEYLTLPNASSQANGKLITEYLKSHTQNDPRKYIVVGYSKGAPDFQEGLAEDPQAASAVAAFVTVAGAVGGSPIANVMPEIAKRYMNALHLTSCQGDIAEAFASLRSDARHAFLDAHPKPLVPSYSIVALSDKTDTSKMLLESWQMLGVYGPEEDSQLLRQDAIVPGATYLGAARADHLAIALPFDEGGNSEVLSLLDHNHYPRAALLEAAIRLTIQDLEKPQ